MRRIIVLGCALALAGCATLQNVGDRVCERESVVRAGLEASKYGAYVIQDPDRRAALLAAIDEAIAALDACPEPAQ